MTSARHYFLGLVIIGLAATTVQADYTIDWHTIDGGGGRSTGSNFELVGTIGQSDAGPGSAGMTGAGFELSGGYWQQSFAPVCVCPGDTNSDGVKNGSDIQNFIACLTQGGNCSCADMNASNSVTLDDAPLFVQDLLSGSSCPPPPPPVGDTCAVASTINCGQTINGNNTGFADNYNLQAGLSCTGYQSLGPDLVYKLAIGASPPSNIMVSLDPIGPGFDASVYALTDCANLSTCVGGADALFGVNNPNPETFNFVPAANTNYFIVCDGYDGAAFGPFDLSITCTP